jgi:hypothetical protein
MIRHVLPGLWVALLLSCPVAIAQIKVGAMGDSITDEWSNLDPAGARFGYKTTGVRNWVELGELSGRLDFGTYTRYDSPSGNEEVRRGGADRSSFSWNFARGGASTEANGLDALNRFFSRSYTQLPAGDGTLTNLPKNFHAMARDRVVDYGVVMIGGNDFLHGILVSSHFKDLPASDPANVARLDAMKSALGSAIRRVTNDGALAIKMTLGNLFDLGAALASAGVAFTATQRTNIRENVAAWNSRVDDLAAHLLVRRPIPVVSLWDWWEGASAPDFRVHGIRVRAHAAPAAEPKGGEAPLPRWNTLTLPDGVHPAPIGSALIVQRFVEAVNASYGAGLQPLSPKELVTLSGLDPQRPPIAVAGGPYSVCVGEPLVLDASKSADPNPGDVPLLKYDWDLNDDGVFDVSGIRPTVNWSTLSRLGIKPGRRPVRVRVDDTFGGVMISAPSVLEIKP